MNEKEIKMIKDLYPRVPENDFNRFIYVAEQTGLNPLRNQIYLVERNSKDKNGNWKKNYTIQTSIDGLRIVAERTGKYAPEREPLLLKEEKELMGATAYVKKMTDDGNWHTVAATAYFDEYVQLDKSNNPTRFWKKMPRLMIAKCAEALALRKSFPDALSGIYTDDEMGQSTNEDVIKPNENISTEEARVIKEMINGDKKAVEMIKEEFGVEKISDILKSDYETIVTSLRLYNLIEETNEGKDAVQGS